MNRALGLRTDRQMCSFSGLSAGKVKSIFGSGYYAILIDCNKRAPLRGKTPVRLLPDNAVSLTSTFPQAIIRPSTGNVELPLVVHNW
jgi:hypothetical protein